MPLSAAQMTHRVTQTRIRQKKPDSKVLTKSYQGRRLSDATMFLFWFTDHGLSIAKKAAVWPRASGVDLKLLGA